MSFQQNINIIRIIFHTAFNWRFLQNVNSINIIIMNHINLNMKWERLIVNVFKTKTYLVQIFYQQYMLFSQVCKSLFNF